MAAMLYDPKDDRLFNRRLVLERIHPETVKMITENTVTAIRAAEGVIPPDELHWLTEEPYADLGITGWPEPTDNLIRYIRGWGDLGLAVPNIGYRLRRVLSGLTVIERATGDELVMPEYWKNHVALGSGSPDGMTWFGDGVRDPFGSPGVTRPFVT